MKRALESLTRLDHPSGIDWDVLVVDNGSTDADLVIRFNKDYYAFRHDRLGLIGPAPCRRPGGHTGGQGMGCYLNGSGSGEDLGSFPTHEVSEAVAALVGYAGASRPLAQALLRVR